MTSVQNHQQQLSGNKFCRLNRIVEACRLSLCYFYALVLKLKVYNLESSTVNFSLLTIIFLASCSPKTTPVVKNPPPQKVEEKNPQPAVKEKTPELSRPKIKENTEMVISMILPFELKTINPRTATSTDLRKAEIAIDLFQGFKMALDSVAKQSSNVDFKLQVFDSNDNPTALGQLAMKPAIKNSDLIIGPVFPNGIKAFSVYSKSMKKPMVSPLAASDPALFANPYLITVNNSLDQHAFKAAKFIKSDLKPKKVLLIRSGQADEGKYAVPFKKGMDSLAKGYRVSELGIKAIGYENVYKHLIPTGLNVIVLPSTDRVFLLTIFKELEKASRTFQIAVIGHPGWEKAAYLDFQQLENINAYLTSSYQIDYQSYRTRDFVDDYRSKFSLEPSEYAFKGFDIGYYFATLMNKSERQFMEGLANHNFDGIHNDFNFINNAKTGFYNSDLMMLKYQNSGLVKVN